MKRWSKALLIVLALCLFTVPALAASGAVDATLAYRDIRILVDGSEITPTDVNGQSTEPFTLDGTTYLPLRAVAQALGCDVDWDDATGSVIINTGNTLSADNVIESITVLGTVDWDCSKAEAIAIKYSVDMTGANVDTDTYQVNDYGTTLVPVAESTGDAGQGGYGSNGNGIQPGAP